MWQESELIKWYQDIGLVTYFRIILPKGFEVVSTGVVLVASVEGIVLVADADKVK